jgi:cell division FtsZ-interacting protein ZapD
MLIGEIIEELQLNTYRITPITHTELMGIILDFLVSKGYGTTDSELQTEVDRLRTTYTAALARASKQIGERDAVIRELKEQLIEMEGGLFY